MTSEISKPPLWRRCLMFIYVSLPLLAYPAVLIIVQDFPDLSRFDLKQYLNLISLAYFSFEGVVLSSGFILIFLSVLTLLFAKQARLQFVILASILSMLGYSFGTILIANVYPLSFYREHFHSCRADLPICYPPLVHGYVMTFSVILAIILSEHLLYGLLKHKVFGRSPVRFGVRDVSYIFYLLLPIVANPAFIILAEIFPNWGEFRINRFFESTRIPYFSYQSQLLTLSFLVTYMTVFTWIFVKKKKAYFFLAVSILSYALYNLGTYLDLSGFLLVIKHSSCHSDGSSDCLTSIELGVLFCLSATCSIAIVERLVVYLDGRQPTISIRRLP